MSCAPDSPQTPTTAAGATDGGLADDIGRLLAPCGIELDPWQRLVLDAWTARRPDGQWAHFQCGLAVPRQNGKNLCLEARELFGAAVLGERVLHTAHEVKTARKHFARLKYFFGERPDDPAAAMPALAAMVRAVRNTNGQEAVLLTNGGSIEIAARSRGSGRGYTVDVLVVDEAQELSDDALEALAPTLAAAPLGNPQQIWTGTVPGPNSLGDAWTRLRSSAPTAPATSWLEWAAPGDDDGRDAVARANPALEVGRLSQRVVDGERAALSPDGFARERLGRWPSASGPRRAIGPDLWASSAARPPASGTRAAALVGASDGHWALAAAVHDGGRTHVNVVASAPAPGASLDPALDWLAARWGRFSAVRLFGGTTTPAARAALERRGLPMRRVRQPSTGDYLDACSLLLSGLSDGTVTHPAGDGTDALSLSAARTDRRVRRADGAFGWVASAPGGDAAPLEAASLAAAAARTTRRRPGRRQQFMTTTG